MKVQFARYVKPWDMEAASKEGNWPTMYENPDVDCVPVTVLIVTNDELRKAPVPA